jgi:hypothetical protein
VGAEIATILTKAMAQNPELRYRSAAEFREALRRVGRRAPNRQRYQPYPAGSVLFSEVADDLEMFQSFHASPSRKSNPAFVTSVVLMLLLAAAGLFYGFPQWRKAPVAAPSSEPTLRPARGRQPEKVPATGATKFGSSNRESDTFRSASPKSTEVAERRSRQERNASSNNAVAEQVQRLEKVKLASPESTPRTPILETKIEPSRQIRIPNIRLPAAEVPVSDVLPTAKPRLLDTYSPTSRTVSSFTTRKP